jgi:hypothetical protein
LEDGVNDYVKNYLLKSAYLGYWKLWEWEKALTLVLTHYLIFN